jgi:nucleotide-binding universal stress UspA family protein
MKNILLAVDDTKGSKEAVSSFVRVCKCINPERLILLHVEKLEGRSLIDGMLGDPEMATLKETLEGTEYKEALDRRARRILDYYSKAMSEGDVQGVETMVRAGHPAEEIMQAAAEEGADMIIIGSRGKRTSHLFMGSVSREVADRSQIPVLLVKSPSSV